MLVQTQQVTADDLWQRPDHGGPVELVRGEVVAKMSPAGHLHGRGAGRLHTFVGYFVYQNRLGEVYTAETGFILARDPDTVRAPDLAFVSKARAAQQPRRDGFFVGAPDLAVEVVSPDEGYEDVQEKVFQYLDAGTALAWVLNPRLKRVFMHRAGRDVRVLTTQDTLDGEDVLPGFALPLALIFED